MAYKGYPNKEWYDAVQELKKKGLAETTTNIRAQMAGTLDMKKDNSAEIRKQAEALQKKKDALEKQRKTAKIKKEAEEIQRQLDEKQRILDEAHKQGITGDKNIPASVYEAVGVDIPDDILEPEGEGEGDGDSKDLEIPESLKNDPYFQQLTPEEQATIVYYESVLASDNAEEQEALADAFDLATEQAEPYWKSILAIAKDELSRALGTLEADLTGREAELTRRSKEIEEDLIYNKDNLTTEESAELARQKKSYDIELEGIGETMAQRGLTSSTIRNRATTRLEEVNKDNVESVQRSYDRQQRAQSVGAERLQLDITKETEDLQRRATETKTGAVRGAEAYLGTEEVKGLGLEQFALGGIKGGIKEEKATDILQRQQALMLSGL